MLNGNRSQGRCPPALCIVVVRRGGLPPPVDSLGPCRCERDLCFLYVHGIELKELVRRHDCRVSEMVAISIVAFSLMISFVFVV